MNSGETFLSVTQVHFRFINKHFNRFLEICDLHKKNPQWLISKYLWIQDSWTWTHTEIGRSKVFMFIFSPFFVVDFPYIWIYIYKCVFVYPFIRYWSGLISICFGHLSSLYPLTDTVGCIGMVVYCWLHGANFFFLCFSLLLAYFLMETLLFSHLEGFGGTPTNYLHIPSGNTAVIHVWTCDKSTTFMWIFWEKN